NSRQARWKRRSEYFELQRNRCRLPLYRAESSCQSVGQLGQGGAVQQCFAKRAEVCERQGPAADAAGSEGGLPIRWRKGLPGTRASRIGEGPSWQGLFPNRGG